jgi:hypothetical protein
VRLHKNLSKLILLHLNLPPGRITGRLHLSASFEASIRASGGLIAKPIMLTATKKLSRNGVNA